MTWHGQGKTGYPDNNDPGQHKDRRKTGGKKDQPDDQKHLTQHQGNDHGTDPVDVLPVPVAEFGLADIRKRGIDDQLHQPDKDNQAEIDNIKPQGDIQNMLRYSGIKRTVALVPPSPFVLNCSSPVR